MQSKSVRLRNAAIVLLVAVAAYAATLSPYGSVSRSRLYDDIGNQLGFRHYTPAREGRERLALSYVRSGSPMAAAGFQKDDELELDAVDELYYRIATNQHRTLSFTIVRNGQRLEIVLNVPELKLRADPRKALWFR